MGGPEPSDSDLVDRARRGDAAATELLLTRHTDRAYAICRRILVDHQDALDATQEALISVVRSIRRFDGKAAFTTWLHRIATNAALDELRRRRRRPEPAEVLPEGPASHDSGRAADRAGDRIDVDRALASLPEEFRVAVLLRDLADLDYAEIARILDVPPGTVRSRIARGRRMLAQLLGNPAAGKERPTVGAPASPATGPRPDDAATRMPTTPDPTAEP